MPCLVLIEPETGNQIGDPYLVITLITDDSNAASAQSIYIGRRSAGRTDGRTDGLLAKAALTATKLKDDALHIIPRDLWPHFVHKNQLRVRDLIQ